MMCSSPVSNYPSCFVPRFLPKLEQFVWVGEKEPATHNELPQGQT